MNPFTRGLRNTFRNGIRAFSIIAILAVIIGLALTMLIARGAVNDKITSVKSSIGNTVTVSPAGVRGFEGGGSALTTANVATIRNTAHVAEAVSTLTARISSSDTNLTSAIAAGSFGERRGQTSSGSTGSSTGMTEAPADGGAAGGTANGGTGSSGGGFASIQVTGTSNAASVGEIGTVSLASGSQIDAGGSANEALVGQALATKNSLSVGSTFTLYGQTFTVKGIINTTNNRFAGNAVVVPLKSLQAASSQTDAVSSVSVTPDSVDNQAAVVSALQTRLGSSADVVSGESQAASAVEPLTSIANLSVFVLIASVAVGAVVILLIMVMIVRERRREIGVMKAIGAGNGTIGVQFMVEAATMTVIASVIGIIAAVLAAGPITSLLVTNAASSSTGSGMGGPGGGFRRGIAGAATNIRSVTTHIDWTIVLWGLGAALVIALVGSLIASLWVARVRPSEAVRAE